MSFKTNRAAGSAPRLSGFSLLEFSGPEASAFLQAQTMNDLRQLEPRQWQWNGWLNAKGRVIALFALLRRDAETFVAVLPDYPAEDLLLQLQRFVFRSKVRLRVITDLVAAADFDGLQAGTATDLASVDEDSSWRLDWSGEAIRRQLLLLPHSSPTLAVASADVDARWLDADLAHGLPRLPASQREAWTPQMLSLERLKAFSLKKGCYPGQEIVARTHYLGQAKRGLSRVLGAGLETGADLRDAQGAGVGSVISVAADGRSGLAVIQLEKRGSSIWSDDRKITLAEFASGLQRPL